MVGEITLDGGQPRLVYTINNDTSRPIAVQITIARREISVEGVESRVPAEDILAYPSQLVVAGGEARTVVVEWSGAGTDVELPFRVIAEQIPVDFGDSPEAPARIKMNLRYISSLYVRPPDTVSDPRVARAEIVELPEGVRIGGANGETAVSASGSYAMILVENRGDSRLNLGEVSYRVDAVESMQAGVSVEPADTSVAAGVILPGGRRRIYLRLPDRYAALEAGTPLAVSVAR